MLFLALHMMKTLSMFLAIVAVIVLVLIGLAFYRTNSDQTSTTSETTQQTDEGGPSEAPINQFVQEAPTGSLPPNPENGEEATTPNPSVQPGEKVTVQIDETGFHPQTVTIASGTTVTFVNNGQAAHWPASDVHPTHTVLPGFDSKRGLETGETYEFTFTQKGTWSMHDHLFPTHTGSIVVQ